MKCINCGTEIPDNSTCCKLCGTIYKNTQKNNNAGLFVALGIAAFVAGAGLVYHYFVPKTDVTSEIISEREEDLDFTHRDTSEYKVSRKVEKIDNAYNEFLENAKSSNYQMSLLKNGTVIYSEVSQLKAVLIQEGIDENEYERCYFYDNDQLIYSVFVNQDGHKFYFNDEQLIQWECSEDASIEKSVIQRKELHLEEYAEWEKKLLENSKEYIRLWDDGLCLDIQESFDMNWIEDISATTSLSEYNMTHSANRLIDEDLSTAWVEGASDVGVGEKIVIRFKDDYMINGIELWSGYHKSNELYAKNARPSRVKIFFSEYLEMEYTLNDFMEKQDLVFDFPVYTDQIILEIEDVYSGSKYQDTVISEIKIY